MKFIDGWLQKDINNKPVREKRKHDQYARVMVGNL